MIKTPRGRVFVGLNNVSGVGISLRNGFRSLGFEADFFSAEKLLHKYDYPDGLIPEKIPVHRNKLISKLGLSFFFLKLLYRYKYFIFLQAGWTLMNKQKDIGILRFFGKKTIVIFVGCDSRVPEKVKMFRWNPCSDCPEDYKKSVNCNILIKTKLIPQLEMKFNSVASPTECSGLLQGHFLNIRFPRGLDSFIPRVPIVIENKKIRILHAPSNTHYKGTKFIRETILNLSERHNNFEFIERQGLPITELHKEILECDLVIDQVLVGYYGLLAVESMCLGKPVVAYIRPDIWEKEKTFSPVYNADPDNLYSVLEQILLNPRQLTKRGQESRSYVEKYHDSGVIAQEILSALS